MLFIVSIHILLWMSSWLIGGRWLSEQPSLKLKLARFLLVSSVLSPLIVHCINPSYKPERLNVVSFDSLQEYVNQPLVSATSSSLTNQSTAKLSMGTIKYYQLVYLYPYCPLPRM